MPRPLPRPAMALGWCAVVEWMKERRRARGRDTPVCWVGDEGHEISTNKSITPCERHRNKWTDNETGVCKRQDALSCHGDKPLAPWSHSATQATVFVEAGARARMAHRVRGNKVLSCDKPVHDGCSPKHNHETLTNRTVVRKLRR